MLQQTIEQLKPLLALLQQPAFCVRADGAVFRNPAAQNLAPENSGDLSQWLGAAAQIYDHWNRTEPLTFSTVLNEQTYSVDLQPLADGTLFLLTGTASYKDAGEALSVAAQVMRQPLTDLYALSQRLFEELEDMEDPSFLNQTAAMTRHLYRLVRISDNLADWRQLQNGRWMLHEGRLELLTYLTPLLEELSYLCEEAGHSLHYTMPRKPVRLSADSALLERALCNLLSNALKYSLPASPIALSVDVAPTAVLFRIQNQCSPQHMDLLTSAFRRIEQRGLLPDPDWGVGLGLPLAQRIAALHGGTVALSMGEDGVATVTMSVQRKPRSMDLASVTIAPRLASGGLRGSLVELSDVLPPSCYDSTLL